MKRTLPVAVLLLTLAGCQLPPERAALQPLPADVHPLPYAQLLTRARDQAKLANEAFYVDRWEDLENAARGLQQTARYLAQAEDVPPKQKGTLTATTGDLNKEAAKLLEAAKSKKVGDATRSLQRIQLTVRELRLDK